MISRALTLTTEDRQSVPELGPPALVPIDQILPADSPRIDGEDATHTHLLAQSEEELPPIVVHRDTMCVIDGMHRLRAAYLKGRDTIRVRFFDGPADMVFVLAVQANITHGLPLSVQDREAAAERIMIEHPEWSDRVIADASGLSSKTVGAVRRRAGASVPEVKARLGRDGRLRPVDRADGRERASRYIASNPAASLREIAREAGISPSTARDVRARLERGDDPGPTCSRRPGSDRLTVAAARASTGHGVAGPCGTRRTILAKLRRDPSLRSNRAGRELLRWLDARAGDLDMWDRLGDSVPPHASYLLADFAQSVGRSWLTAGDLLKNRLSAVG
jgi:ParB-like chromosome segregation protein Spo0J